VILVVDESGDLKKGSRVVCGCHRYPGRAHGPGGGGETRP
jgi:hypothetical protein